MPNSLPEHCRHAHADGISLSLSLSELPRTAPPTATAAQEPPSTAIRTDKTCQIQRTAPHAKHCILVSPIQFVWLAQH